jgi:fucose permease
MPPTTSTLFIRDRFTWLAYFMLAYYAYFQATLGPVMPFLREELAMSYTLGGLHFSAFAMGMVISGLRAAIIARRWGRETVFWGGGAGMAAGALLFSVGTHPAVTIFSSFLMGLLGSLLLVMIQASLSDHHGERRAISLTEANIAASVFAALAPLLVGLGERIGAGWRAALFVGMAAWMVLFRLKREATVPDHRIDSPQDGPDAAAQRLPVAFWAYWIVIFVGTSIEWCLIFWSADFLENVVDLPKETASALVSVFLVAMIIGRIIGSRLTRTVSSTKLLPFAIGVVTLGFPLFWLAQTPLANIVGLFVAGLGMANLFPLSLSSAVTVAADQSDVASARVSLAAGSAILMMPQVLGSFADHVGIFYAYGVVAVLLVALIIAYVLANQLSTRQA